MTPAFPAGGGGPLGFGTDGFAIGWMSGTYEVFVPNPSEKYGVWYHVFFDALIKRCLQGVWCQAPWVVYISLPACIGGGSDKCLGHRRALLACGMVLRKRLINSCLQDGLPQASRIIPGVAVCGFTNGWLSVCCCIVSRRPHVTTLRRGPADSLVWPGIPDKCAIFAAPWKSRCKDITDTGGWCGRRCRAS